jgi:hypothetical protein
MKKNLLVLAGVIGLSYLLLPLVFENDKSNKLSDSALVDEVNSSGQELQVEKEFENFNDSLIVNTDIKVPKDNEITDVEAAEIREWQEQRGYPQFMDDGTIINSPYESYDSQTLLKLVEQGEPKAMQILGDRALKQGDLDSAKTFYFSAAVFGYTKNLVDIGNIYIHKYNNEMNEEKKRDLAVVAYSWYELASKRGDIQVEFAKDLIGNKITFSDEEKQKVLEKSNELYSELVRKRQQLGLGEFNNDHPKALKKLFGN